MKILWLSHLIPYPPIGGVLQRSYNLVREVSKQHDLHLVAFNQQALLTSMFSTEQEGKEAAMKHLQTYCRSVDFIDIPSDKNRYGKHSLALKSLFTRNPYSINWLESGTMRDAIRAVKDKHEFDLVHFDTISLAPYLDLFEDNLPKTLDHHNIESHMMLRRASLETNPLKKFYFYQEGMKLLRYEKQVCKQFDVNITCSVLDSERLREIDPSLTIDEIPNGVDTEFFKPGNNASSPERMIFAGGLDWYPNRDAMLFFADEIWPLLKAADPELIMDVVGKFPPDEIVRLSHKDENYNVHGFVEDVLPYIDRAGVYVCPIRDGGGTKLKLLDAFSMAKAVVAHPAACEGLDVIDGYNVLLAETAKDFTACIQRIRSDKELRLSLGKHARKLAKNNYSFISIGEKLSSLYLGFSSKTVLPIGCLCAE